MEPAGHHGQRRRGHVGPLRGPRASRGPRSSRCRWSWPATSRPPPPPGGPARRAATDRRRAVRAGPQASWVRPEQRERGGGLQVVGVGTHGGEVDHPGADRGDPGHGEAGRTRVGRATTPPPRPGDPTGAAAGAVTTISRPGRGPRRPAGPRRRRGRARRASWRTTSSKACSACWPTWPCSGGRTERAQHDHRDRRRARWARGRAAAARASTARPAWACCPGADGPAACGGSNRRHRRRRRCSRLPFELIGCEPSESSSVSRSSGRRPRAMRSWLSSRSASELLPGSTRSAMWRLPATTSSTRSSTVPGHTRRCDTTVRVWPMRQARSRAWSSTAGFHQRS